VEGQFRVAKGRERRVRVGDEHGGCGAGGDRGGADRNRGNRRKAAETLGIGERTLYRKLKEYEAGPG